MHNTDYLFITLVFSPPIVTICDSLFLPLVVIKNGCCLIVTSLKGTHIYIYIYIYLFMEGHALKKGITQLNMHAKSS